MCTVEIDRDRIESVLINAGVKQTYSWKRHWGYQTLAFSLLFFFVFVEGLVGVVYYIMFDGPSEMMAPLLISPLLLYWGYGGLKTFRYVHHRYYLQFNGSRVNEMDVWMDKVLREAGFRFTKTSVPYHKDAFTTNDPKYVYELEDHETTIFITGNFFNVIICVGPFRKDLKEECERLMVVIEGALRRDQRRIVETLNEWGFPEEVDLGEALIGLSS